MDEKRVRAKGGLCHESVQDSIGIGDAPSFRNSGVRRSGPAQLLHRLHGRGFYAIGGGLADFVTKHVPGVEVTAVTSGGVNENINRLDSGQAEIGMLNIIDPLLAFEGKAPYKKPFNKMRGMGILYLQYGQPYTLASTGIRTYLDLKDKVVCAGSPGGSMHQQFFNRVRIHGLDPDKDFRKVVYLPAREAMEALKAGQIDAVMLPDDGLHSHGRHISFLTEPGAPPLLPGDGSSRHIPGHCSFALCHVRRQQAIYAPRQH